MDGFYFLGGFFLHFVSKKEAAQHSFFFESSK